MFPIMGLLGKVQSPEAGARKNADCIEGQIGKSGDLLGAPEGVAIGELVNQKPMHPGFTTPVL